MSRPLDWCRATRVQRRYTADIVVTVGDGIGDLLDKIADELSSENTGRLTQVARIQAFRQAADIARTTGLELAEKVCACD